MSLQAELKAVEWRPYHHHGWSGFTITRVGGEDVSDRFTSCMALADPIPGPAFRATLFKLDPGAVVPRHADNDIHLWDPKRDVAGFHIALVTNPGCLMVWWRPDGTPYAIHLAPGQIVHHDWAHDHLVVNGGDEPRIHLYVEKPLTTELWRFIASRRETP